MPNTPASPPPGSALYQHVAHPHQPRNVNEAHKAERRDGGFNQRLAVLLTRVVGTMPTAYIFAGIGVGSLIGVFTNNVFLAALFGSFSSYFLQLVLLPVISVGQGVLSRHQELQADETYEATQRSFHDIEQVGHHLGAQDEELLKQTAMLAKLVEKLVPDHGE